jgi:hypothetical protein
LSCGFRSVSGDWARPFVELRTGIYVFVVDASNRRREIGFGGEAGVI